MSKPTTPPAFSELTVTNPSPKFTVDDSGGKRFRIPGLKIRWKCKCGKRCVQDFGKDDYFSFPDMNQPFDHGLYCHECGEESQVRLQLSLTLSVC